MALTDYVLMPRADYVGMCDKMREIKETTNIFTSGQFLEEMAGLVSNAGGSDSGNLQVYANRVTAPSNNMQVRVNVEFGFVPDFLIVWQDKEITITSGRIYPVCRWGFSAAAQEKLPTGKLHSGQFAVSSTRVYFTPYTNPIDGTTRQHIYNVDETGFTLDITPEYSTTLYVVALKFT